MQMSSYIPLGLQYLVIFWFSLGISDDLINFWDESIKNKMAAAAIWKKMAA